MTLPSAAVAAKPAAMATITSASPSPALAT
jgi:hypothetical protein